MSTATRRAATIPSAWPASGSTAGFKVRPARVVGHCITQVHYDGRWNLLDGDMGPFYLLRDNATIASEQDLVRDHDLIKCSHTHGILDRDSRAAAEWSAAMFVYEGEAEGDRNSVRDTTMNMVLRPNEALVWRWATWRRSSTTAGPTSRSGASGRRIGFATASGSIARTSPRRPGVVGPTRSKRSGERRGPRAEPGKTGVLLWKMRSPYVFVGGRLEVEGEGALFSLSWDGKSWQKVGDNLDALFPANGPARYEYRLKCELPEGGRLGDSPSSTISRWRPSRSRGWLSGRTASPTRTNRRVPSRPPHPRMGRAVGFPSTRRSPAPVFPTEGGRTDSTDIVFQWRPPVGARETASRTTTSSFPIVPDMAWPLSSNFSKLVSNTADRGKARYRVPSAGLLHPAGNTTGGSGPGTAMASGGRGARRGASPRADRPSRWR